MKKSLFIPLILAVFLQSCHEDTGSYFRRATPGNTPELFAPGIVNTESIELNVVFNNTFTEMFFSRIVDGSFVIHHSELINGRWTAVEPIQMYADDIAISVACDPTITADGKTMYFLGVDPELYSNDVSLEKLYRIPPDIYESKKVNGKWQHASKTSFPVSTEHFESYPIVVNDGSLYFQSNRPGGSGGRDTYRAQYREGGRFETPVGISLNSEANASSSYISPDETYLIASNPKGFQVSFKTNGEWQPSKRVDLPYDPDWIYFCPYMSPDGKYFFFTRRYSGSAKRGWAGVTQGEVLWVSADVIFDLR